MAEGFDAAPKSVELSQAVSAFVRAWEGKLETHFSVEERAASREAEPAAPGGWNGADGIQRERDAVAALLDLLRHRYVALSRNEADARADVIVAIDDLTAVWARHVRRLLVLGPLLSGERGGRRG